MESSLMRLMPCLFLFFVALSDVCGAATISGSMNPNLGGFPGAAYNSYNQATQVGSLISNFGTSTPGQVPDDGGVRTGYMSGNFDFTPSSGKGYVSTTVRRSGTQFFTTTQAWYDTTFGGVLNPMVQHAGYWEFVVQGSPGTIANYSYTIDGQAPQISVNKRFYSFVRVDGATETTLHADNVGTSTTSFAGTVTSGTYRLYFDHRNFSPGTAGPPLNPIGGTNLDIRFTFQSETPDGSGGVVPEPASIAVFGVLGACGAVSRLRRKK